MNVLKALDILRLPPNPTTDDINQAFKKGILLCHPDKGPAREKSERHRRTQEMNAARAFLTKLAEERKAKEGSYAWENENEAPQDHKSKPTDCRPGVRPFSSSFRGNGFKKDASDPFSRGPTSTHSFRQKRPTAAESMAGAAALNRSRSRRNFMNGKKPKKATDFMKEWKKAAPASTDLGRGMDAQNLAYEKKIQEQKRKVEELRRKNEEKRAQERAWGWSWHQKVGQLQRDVSHGEPGAVDINSCVRLERELRNTPFHQNLIFSIPTLESSLNWLRNQQLLNRNWSERVERKSFMNLSDAKSRILEIRKLQRETSDFAVNLLLYRQLSDVLVEEQERYRTYLNKMARQRERREQTRAAKKAARAAQGFADTITSNRGSLLQSTTEPEPEVVPEPSFQDLLDIDMCEEGWTVENDEYFVIPNALMNGIANEAQKLPDITKFSSLSSVNMWRDLYAKTFDTAQEEVLSSMADLEKQRSAEFVPGSHKERERFLKEAEEREVPEEGDLVEVMQRKWAGVNDEGGRAKVISINKDEGTVDVKYVIDNRKVKNLELKYVKKCGEEEEQGGRGRRARKQKVKVTITRDELVERVENFLLVLMQRECELRAPALVLETDVANKENLSKHAQMICSMSAKGDACRRVFKREAMTVINCSQPDVAYQRLPQLQKDLECVFSKLILPQFSETDEDAAPAPDEQAPTVEVTASRGGSIRDGEAEIDDVPDNIARTADSTVKGTEPVETKRERSFNDDVVDETPVPAPEAKRARFTCLPPLEFVENVQTRK